MVILLIYSVLIFIMNPCHSQDCEAVNSLKHGKLDLGRSANPSLKCISNWIFENKETGKKFCLDKKSEKADKLTCINPSKLTETGCSCGQENKPQQKTKMREEVGIVGGNEVGENQYPWYAMILDTNLLGRRPYC